MTEAEAREQYRKIAGLYSVTRDLRDDLTDALLSEWRQGRADAESGDAILIEKVLAVGVILPDHVPGKPSVIYGHPDVFQWVEIFMTALALRDSAKFRPEACGCSNHITAAIRREFPEAG